MNIEAPKRTATRDTFNRLESAIETISNGLHELGEVDGFDKLEGPRFVDLVARLNAQANALEKIVKPMKEQLKAEGIANKELTIRGHVYQGIIKYIPKIVMDNDKVKEFLGRNLHKYQVERTDITISFSVKE